MRNAIAWLATLLLACSPSTAASLVVHVTRIDSHHGQLKVGIFANANGWPSDKGAITGQNVPLASIKGDDVDVTFANVKPGDYAVGRYHDANGNNRLDKNFLGVPKEQWGVSNNVKPHLRAPRFDEARFKVNEPSTSIEVELHR